MRNATSIEHIAIVGSGTIGAAWSAWFLARGYRVTATDADPARADFVRRYVSDAWQALSRLGFTKEASAEIALRRFAFAPDIAACVAGADFVQENAPERLDLKQALLAEIDRALPPDRVIASSTSGFTASALQAEMTHPERLVIGHPFNPVHLIPLVEVVGGARTAPEAVETALAFYAATGKRSIHIRKEVAGHLANRLQAALWREAVHLVAEGVASVADVDAAVAYGPGIRWAIMGPHLTFHLAGGAGGMENFLHHLGPPMQGWWGDLGAPALTPEVSRALVEGVTEAIGDDSFDSLVATRDERLLRVLDALNKAGDPAP